MRTVIGAPGRAILPLSLMALLAGLAGAATIPRPAPEFVIQGPSGQALLSQFRGKVILLTFMFTTCSHCQHSVGVINPIQKEYGPRGFQALGAAFNEGAAQLLPQFLAQFQPAYPMGAATRDTVMEYLQVSPTAPIYVPVFVFIDKKGMIREQHIGDNDKFLDDQDKNIRAVVESLLKESGSASKVGKKKP
jgi:thiol-disulfide isomerase/thioredoxin